MPRAAFADRLSGGAAPARWLPPGKSAAICFSIDDLHPGTSADTYEAGGDLGAGALGRLRRLQQRHPLLKATLCVTPDWRLNSLVPDARVLRHIPWVNRYVYWSRPRASGHFRVDRHPRFVRFLNLQQRCEVVLHGLHHLHVGPRFAVEFQNETVTQCAASIRRGMEIFRAAGLSFVPGYVPPAWQAPQALIDALGLLQFRFLCSARDVQTPIAAEAQTNMSGLKGVSLLYPQPLGAGGLIHLACNFQATSPLERAVAILKLGGVLHIKAHIFKSDGRHTMQDGLDELYCNYLDLLFQHLERRFGARLWWAHLSEVAERAREAD